MIKALKMERAI
jgi:hypothetical protein